MRSGRRTGKNSAASQLIFSHIGPGFPIGSQAELRRVARLGSNYMTLLRHCPEKLPLTVLIRLAEAVALDAAEVLRSVGHKCTDSDIEVLRQKMKRDEEGRLHFSAINFSADELQAMVELEKLIQGPVPLSHALQFLAIRRKNSEGE